ncbi:MAG: YIP1 family protein [Xanthomonadales bacterium]|nr:YIP1 family protein [Xanthomonadales bacterium]
MSPLSTLLAVFVEPAKAMQAVRERSMAWFPLLLLVGGTAIVWVWYYQIVDIAWLQDQMLSAGGQKLSPEQIAASKSFMTRGFLIGSTIVSVAIMLPLIMLISAVYYLLAAKVVGSDIGFGKWFAFAVWTSVPALLLVPAGIIKILTSSNGQLTQQAVNPLSLNELLFHLPVSSPWAGLANAIHIPSIWAAVVAIIGYKLWTGKSTVTSAIVVLLPLVVIYGGWAAFAFLHNAA